MIYHRLRSLARTFYLLLIDATDALLTQLKKVSYQKALLTALYSTCQKYLQELSYDRKGGKKTSLYNINTFSVQFDIRTQSQKQYHNIAT